MKRIRSILRFAVPLALQLGASMGATLLLGMPTFAEDSIEFNNWGTTYVKHDDTDAKRIYLWVIDSDGNIALHTYDYGWTLYRNSGSDPGPDDPTQRIDKVDVADLIKKGLITYTVKANPEDTPLAKWIERDGGGFVPHWNNDDDKGRPGLPKVPTDHDTDKGLTDKQKAEITRLVNYAAKTLGELGTSMGEGEALGGESAPTFNKSGSSGRSKGTGTGEGSKNTGVYVPRDIDSLGARPDLVNPPHSKSKSSGAMSPGLLEGGSSLSTNGPAGAGTAIGKGGGTTSRGIGAAGR